LTWGLPIGGGGGKWELIEEGLDFSRYEKEKARFLQMALRDLGKIRARVGKGKGNGPRGGEKGRREGGSCWVCGGSDWARAVGGGCIHQVTSGEGKREKASSNTLGKSIIRRARPQEEG